MTAPAAPIIGSRQNGGLLRVSWRAIEDATDYNVYLGESPDPTGLEDTLDAALDEGPTGWFVWWTDMLQVGTVHVRVTALNVGAEESAYSNCIHHYMNSDADHLDMTLTQAADINRKL